MKFFGKDIDRDLLFLEQRSKYYLASWMAIDIENFLASKEIKIGSLTKQRLYDQFSLAIRFVMEADDIKQFTKGAHKNCLSVVSKRAKLFLEYLDIDALLKRSSGDSVNAFYDLSKANNQFFKSYQKYLDPNDFENKIYKGTKHFDKGFVETCDLLFHFNEADHDQIIKRSKLISSSFFIAEQHLKNALLDERGYELFRIQFQTLANNLKDIERRKYLFQESLNSNIEYIKVFKELCLINRLFHENLSEDIKFMGSLESMFLFDQMDQYQALMIRHAIDACLSVLKVVNSSIPHIEIFSGRLIKDPVYDVLGKRYV